MISYRLVLNSTIDNNHQLFGNQKLNYFSNNHEINLLIFSTLFFTYNKQIKTLFTNDNKMQTTPNYSK